MKKAIIETTRKEIKDLDRDLTFKQKAWLKFYFESGNATQAALKAYETDDPGSASVIASENLAKLKNPIKTLMELKGLSLGDLIETVKEARLANKPIGALVLIKKGKDGKPEQILKDNEGMIEVPDHLTRLKAVEIAGKWLGIENKENAEQGNLKKRIVAEEFFQ